MFWEAHTLKVSPLILALLLTACGQDDEIEPVFKPIINYYLGIAPNAGHIKQLVSVKFGDPDSGERAHCEVSSLKGVNAERRITVKTGTRGKTLYAAVLHELGHCLHGLKHTSTAGSIMYPYAQSEEYWDEHFDAEAIKMFQSME